MSTTTTNGFQYLTVGDVRMLCLESRNLHACLQHLAADHSLGIMLSANHGFQEDDFACLEEVPWVEAVHLYGIPAIDISHLYLLQSLKRIGFVENYLSAPIDLSRFTLLENVEMVWTDEQGASLVRCLHVRELILHSYGPRTRDLRLLSPLAKLRSLSLYLPRIESLAGIESLRELEALDIQQARSLRQIGALESLSASLRSVRIDECRNLADVEKVVRKLTSLRRLALCGGPPLVSIAFINHLPALEFFAFVDTPVGDGDMTPCLRLRYAGFTNKRNFSHRFEEVRAHIIAQGRSDYPT